jgi:hypothetical protein
LPDGATQLLADLVARRRQIVEMMGAEGQRERGCHRAQEPALSISKLRGACLCASTEASQGRAHAKRSGAIAAIVFFVYAGSKLDRAPLSTAANHTKSRNWLPRRFGAASLASYLHERYAAQECSMPQQRVFEAEVVLCETAHDYRIMSHTSAPLCSIPRVRDFPNHTTARNKAQVRRRVAMAGIDESKLNELIGKMLAALKLPSRTASFSVRFGPIVLINSRL